MKRVVLDCLPFEDPANEARRIVWNGMTDVIDLLTEEDFEALLPGPLGGHPGSLPPGVHILVDHKRGITFCSREVDKGMQAFESLYGELSAQWRAAVRLVAGPDPLETVGVA